MKERLRYRSWTIGAKTLASHALLALFAIVFACVVAYALSFRYVQDQAMEELDLYGTIDACVCCLDSINYVTSPKKLARAFRRVHTFLMPGGLFLFDINTPQKLRGLDGQMFLDESEDAYCVWRADWSERRRICTYGMDIFRLDPGGLWSRWEEVHEEYAYEPAELEELLRQAGFRQIRQYGELRFRAPREGEQRIFFAARKEF